MPIKKQIEELTGWMNWNYIGLAAGVLSVIVTVYNINKYWSEIRKVEKQ
jgi:hypothetical protein